jgi:hypothetical protein
MTGGQGRQGNNNKAGDNDPSTRSPPCEENDDAGHGNDGTTEDDGEEEGRANPAPTPATASNCSRGGKWVLATPRGHDEPPPQHPEPRLRATARGVETGSNGT